MSACKDDDENPPSISGKDQTIMEEISYGNIAEIEMGKVADSISPTPDVKAFGRMMIEDHTVAQTELEQMASRWSLDLPQTPDSLHRAKKQQLMMMSGHAFDTAYIAGQIKDHQATIALLEMAANNSGQQSIRDYANKYLPKVKMHLEHAQEIAVDLQQ
jgi:putative membrane protein